MKSIGKVFCMSMLLAVVTACNNDDGSNAPQYGEEYYAGGINGTVFDITSHAYKQPMPFIDDDATLYRQFMRGERLADKSFVSDTGMGYSGLGPTYIRKSCIACHPSYGGRSRRVDKYDSNDSRCGYLLMVYDPTKDGLPLATKYFTGMTQTRAVAPFKEPIKESGIHIDWLPYTDPETGNKYADGTSYELIYPKVTIDQSAILFPNFDMSQHKACLEATIGIYGTGLLDAISDEDLRAEYAAQQSREFCKGIIGADIDDDATGGNKHYPGKHPGRFTYLCTRGSIENGPGANALWNITNVTRENRKYNYITEEYAKLMGGDSDVRAALGKDSASIVADLMSKSLKPEMTMEDYEAFMVWHRGLAVPAARNLDKPEVKRGKELFMTAGCAACHKPSWTTRANYIPMPQLSNQKIYPYSDLLMHNLAMHEGGRAALKCRTTPLWGRGLMRVVAGHTDMLHDLRARTYEEAILWHGGDGKYAREKFRNMPKEDRDALVKFLEAI